jgi:hypothetical protein
MQSKILCKSGLRLSGRARLNDPGLQQLFICSVAASAGSRDLEGRLGL